MEVPEAGEMAQQSTALAALSEDIQRSVLGYMKPSSGLLRH